MKAFTLTALTALAAGLASHPVFADCVAPPPVTGLPNGATATTDAMVAAMKAVRAYDAAITKYVKCLQMNGGDQARQNYAMETLQRVADQFNHELRVFKAKTSS